MLKLVTLVAVATVSNAFNVMNFERDFTPIDGSNLKLKFGGEFDCLINSFYKGQGQDDHPLERYGWRIQSYADAYANIVLFDFYQYEVRLHTNLLDFTPLALEFSWQVPSSDGGSWHANIKGWRDLTAAEAFTVFSENTKVCSDSFYDAAAGNRPVTADC